MESKCKDPHCNGFRKLCVSQQSHNFGMKYFRCQSCPHFEWFNKVESILKCFVCDANSHFARDCPFNKSPCTIPGCNGVCQVLTSGRDHNKGRKFQTCSKCSYFKWMSPQDTPKPNSNGKGNLEKGSSSSSECKPKPSSSGKKKLTIKVEISLDNVCNEFGGVTLE